MKTEIRPATDGDKETFAGFAVKLSRFNREHHEAASRYDDYETVLLAIKAHAEKTFDNRSQNDLILIARVDDVPAGYVLGRIYEEDPKADNGTGRVGLLDELYLEDWARGLGLGQRLIEDTMDWMAANQIKRIKLHAYTWNKKAAALYEHYGFKEYAVSYEAYI
jgi:GNAT superfamily N-acetyltransferase